MKDILKIMGAITAMGLVLNMAGQGKLGTFAQSIANNVTKGYGV